MRLYFLIRTLNEVEREERLDIVWDIILQFEHYIRKECYIASAKRFDEDLYSEIITKLPERLMNFKIIEDI